MRRVMWSLYLCLLLPSIAFAAIGDAASQAQLLSHRVGYGAAATGGAGGSLCTVNTLADSGGSGQTGSLRHCLGLAGAQWIIFTVSGQIDLLTPLVPSPPNGNNKTIDGRGQSITIRASASDGTALYFSGVTNYIVHNVKFIKSSASGWIVRVLCGQTIWLDHIDLSGGGPNNSGMDMAASSGWCAENTVPASAITISWSKFHDRCDRPTAPSNCSSGMVLLGVNETDTIMANSRMTLHHNWWQQSSETRVPNGRLGHYHSFNNWIDNVDQGIQIHNQGQLRSENDIYDCSQGMSTGTEVIGTDLLKCGRSGNPARLTCILGSPQGASCAAINPYRVVGTEPYSELNAGSIFTPASDYTYSGGGCTSSWSCLETANAALMTKLSDSTTGTGVVSNPYNYLAVGGTDDIVGWWKLDESSGTTANDDSGNNLDGTLTNMESPGDWVQGLISPTPLKGALEFGGTDEYVTIADSDLLSPVTTGEFSICTWVRPAAYNATFSALVSKGTASNYEYALWLGAAGGLQFQLWDLAGSSHALAASSATAALNTWTHVCGTYASAVLTEVFVNGVSSGSSSSFTGTMGNGTSPVNLGRRPDGDSTVYLTGRLDDVRLFNYALTQPEVAAILAEGFDVVYHLDEVASPANDAGQPGLYDGTWQNTPTAVAGKLNGALSFNGSNQYVSVATSPSLSGAATVALWVKMTALPAGAATVLSNADTGNANTQVGFNVNSDGSWSYLYSVGGAARGFPSAASQVPVGSWIHLAATDDGAGNVQLYQSGSPISSTPFGTPTAKPGTAPGLLAIGRAGGASIQYANGAVDEVHVVSRMMSAGEIAALAAEGSGDTTPPAAPTNLRVVSP